MKRTKLLFVTFTLEMIFVYSTFAQSKKFAFGTVDLDGNKITDEIFSKADITVVNIWGTFCPPCIREMPELAEWAASMPSNVQIIGIVSDWNDEGDGRTSANAKKILEKAGAKFTNIAYSYDMNKTLSSMVNLQYVPTTIFFDKEGNMVGDVVIGARVDAYKKVVNEYLSKK